MLEDIKATKTPRTPKEKVLQAISYSIILLLAFVFALEFGGPQSQGCSQGGTKTTVAAEVYGDKVTLGEYRSNFRALGFEQRQPDEIKANRLDHLVLQGLVDRALLAHEARKVGFFASEEDAMKRLVDKNSMLITLDTLSPQAQGRNEIGFNVRDEEGNFDEKRAKDTIQFSFARSVSEFAKAQAEEIMAERMREVIRANVKVSPAEVWDAFVRDTDRVTLEYIRFSANYYGKGLTPSDAEVSAWLAANAEIVNKEYEREKARYTGLDKQVRARQILVKWTGEDDAAKADAKKRADALAKKVAAGADFAAVAKASSEDEDTRAAGGDLGYTPRGRRPEPFDPAVFTLAEGAVSPAVEGPGGYYIFKAEQFREGDVPVDEAKHEIATRMYREVKSDELAKAAADKAIAALQGNKSFTEYDRVLAGLPPLKDGVSAPDGEKDPREGDPSAPKAEESVSFGRTENPISGLNSSALVAAAFDLKEESPLAQTPMKLGREYVVYRLKAHALATEGAFTSEEKDRLTQRLSRDKAEEAVKDYVIGLRAQAEKAGALRLHLDALAPEVVPNS